MRKIIAIILVIITLFCNFSISVFADSNRTAITTSTYSNNEIETLATYFLYNELKNGTTRYGGKYSKMYNIDATRYGVGSINETKNGWEVKGTLFLYDDYGRYQQSGTYRVVLPSYNIMNSMCFISLNSY